MPRVTVLSWQTSALPCSRLCNCAGDETVTFQYLKRAYKRGRDQLFIWAYTDRTGENDFKVKHGRFRLDLWRKFSMQKVVRPWHCCPEKLCVPHPWRCSRPGWMGPWATWANGWQSYQWQGIGSRWSVRSLLLQAIVWFYDLSSKNVCEDVPRLQSSISILYYTELYWTLLVVLLWHFARMTATKEASRFKKFWEIHQFLKSSRQAQGCSYGLMPSLMIL